MIEIHSTDTCCMKVANKTAEIGNIAEVVERLLMEWHYESKFAKQINLVIEEVVSNIIFYAYSDDKEHLITIDLTNQDQRVFIQITDDGKYFNLTESGNDIDIQAPLEERKVGGLGIHILKNLVDHIEYERVGDTNVLRITKYYKTA